MFDVNYCLKNLKSEKNGISKRKLVVSKCFYYNKLILGLLSTASDDEFENLRIKGPNAVQLVKTTPLKLSPLPPIPDTIKEVIYDMLNALAAYHAPEERKYNMLIRL